MCIHGDFLSGFSVSDYVWGNDYRTFRVSVSAILQRQLMRGVPCLRFSTSVWCDSDKKQNIPELQGTPDDMWSPGQHALGTTCALL